MKRPVVFDSGRVAPGTTREEFACRPIHQLLQVVARSCPGPEDHLHQTLDELPLAEIESMVARSAASRFGKDTTATPLEAKLTASAPTVMGPVTNNDDLLS